MANAGLRFNVWTEIRIELLRQLWDRGLAASAIARQLGGGISRCAVIAKVHRLTLARRVRLHGPVPPKKPPAKPRGKILQGPLIVAKPSKPRPPVMRRLVLTELGPRHCRWPVGNPASADFFFCGADREAPPYCPYHTRVAFAAPR
jgi:GcrA cell cycle regulator